MPGYLAPPPNCRAKGIADSDDEDPDGERVPAPVVEEEEEGSEEVPHAGGGEENAPNVGVTIAAATASVEVEGATGVGSCSVAAPPTMMGRGRGRWTTGMSTPRALVMPLLSELPDLTTPEIRQMIESLWTPEGRGPASRSTPISEADWERFVSFTLGVQTPRATAGESPSVGTIPWSLSPPTSAAAQGITIREVAEYAAELRSMLGGT